MGGGDECYYMTIKLVAVTDMSHGAYTTYTLICEVMAFQLGYFRDCYQGCCGNYRIVSVITLLQHSCTL